MPIQTGQYVNLKIIKFKNLRILLWLKFSKIFSIIFSKDLPAIQPIAPVELNQESDLVTSSDHFPRKGTSVGFGTATNNQEEDQDDLTNSVPQPMNLIKPVDSEQVS